MTVSIKIPLPDAKRGTAYSQQLEGYTGVAPWVFVANQDQGETGFPPGLSMNSAGLISGTPLAGAVPKTYTMSVRTTDDNGNGDVCMFMSEIKLT